MPSPRELSQQIPGQKLGCKGHGGFQIFGTNPGGALGMVMDETDTCITQGRRIGRSAKLLRPFEKNLDLIVTGPTRTLKIQGFDCK